MSTGYTKIAIDDLPNLAEGRGIEGLEARGLRDPSGATQTGGMLHKLAAGVRQPFGHVHNEAEEISPDWAAKGTDVLFHAVLATAGVAE